MDDRHIMDWNLCACLCGAAGHLRCPWRVAKWLKGSGGRETRIHQEKKKSSRCNEVCKAGAFTHFDTSSALICRISGLLHHTQLLPSETLPQDECVLTCHGCHYTLQACEGTLTLKMVSMLLIDLKCCGRFTSTSKLNLNIFICCLDIILWSNTTHQPNWHTIKTVITRHFDNILGFYNVVWVNILLIVPLNLCTLCHTKEEISSIRDSY